MIANSADVVIIGSGISALTSAALLVKKGKSVIVLEQYTKPGGYMHSFQRFGETFDTGAHYVGALGPRQPFRVLLEYLDLDISDLFCPLDPAGFDVLRFPEGDIAIPQSYQSVIEELCVLFPNERGAIRTYFEMVKHAVTLFPTYRFDDETDPMAAMEALDISLSSVVEKLTSDRRLRSVFYAYCNLHGVLPQDTPFGFHSIVTDSLIEGPYGLIGGGDALVSRFVSRIQAGGGTVLTKRRVKEVRTIDRMATEVVCENGETYKGDWVISSIHPKATFRLIDDQNVFTPAFSERLNSIKESPGIFGVYAICNGQNFDSRSNRYYFQTSDPDAMFAPRLASDEPSLVFAASAKREWTVADGALPLSLLSPASAAWFDPWKAEKYGRRSQSYNDLKKQLTGNSLKLVARYDKQLVDSISTSVSSTPLTNIHFNGSEEGSAYGLYHSIQNTGARALGPRTKIINLLLTGQSCVFPGLLGASVAALRTCGHIIGIKPVLRELKALGPQFGASL